MRVGLFCQELGNVAEVATCLANVAADSSLKQPLLDLLTTIAAILLQMAAVSLDLGSCWIQVRERPRDENTTAEEYVRELLSVPGRLKVLAVVAVGYPVEGKDPIPVDDLPVGKIQRNRFGM